MNFQRVAVDDAGLPGQIIRQGHAGRRDERNRGKDAAPEARTMPVPTSTPPKRSQFH
jgi:hypothetical protein